MAPHTKWRTLAITLLMLKTNVDASQELMSKMSSSFFKALEECKRELSISDDLVKSLDNFWHEEQDASNRDLGCVILCMASKQDLIEIAEYRVHHQKAYDFARNHGADDETAKKIVKMVHDCEQLTDADTEPCTKVLEVARCFRDRVHSLKWAPEMEVIIEEIMVDM